MANHYNQYPLQHKQHSIQHVSIRYLNNPVSNVVLPISQPSYQMCNQLTNCKANNLYLNAALFQTAAAHANGFPNKTCSQSNFKYVITGRIGKGTFGDIWTATDILTNKKCAIKTIRPGKLLNVDRKKRKNYETIFMCEAKRLIDLQKIKTDEIGKKYILNCIEFLYCNPHKQKQGKKSNLILNLISGTLMSGPCIVIDLCDQSLLHYILYNKRNNKKILLSTIRHISLQLFSAMSFLHGIGNCIHADIKPENILIKYENNNYDLPNIKIADFGNVILFNTKVKTFNLQTLWYRAPEVLFGNVDSISPLIDMWGIGCILYELFSLTGNRLFKCNEGFSQIHVVNKICFKISKFPIYMYNKYESQYFNKYNTFFTNDISHISLKNKRKCQLINNLIKINNLNTNALNTEFLNFIDLLSGLLDVNPITRYTSQDSINHKFITCVLDALNDNSNTSSCRINHKLITYSNDDQRQDRINMQIIKYKTLLSQQCDVTSQKDIYVKQKPY